MARICAVSTAFPQFRYEQSEILSGMLELCRRIDPTFSGEVVRKFFNNVGVARRHLSLPVERYLEPRGFGARNQEFGKVAVDLGERAVEQVLRRAELDASDVQLFVTNTVTGIAVPSIEARLMNRLPFAANTKRMPLFGLGCVAGAAGTARVNDYLHAYPDQAAILLCVELCSLTQQNQDLSLANIIASALFGDGAAAVLVVGDQHRLANRNGPRILATESVFFPNTEAVMGWEVVDSGLKIVLGKGVPELAGAQLPGAIREFLARQGLTVPDISTWIAHPGGPAVIDALQQALELDPNALSFTRRCLSEVGNLSSASVLAVLEDVQSRARPERGAYGLMLAMGPGFCAELVLLQW